MLIDEPRVLRRDFLLDIVGDGKPSTRVSTGVYEVGNYGSSEFLRPGYYRFYDAPQLRDKDDEEFSNYGVCDDVKQIIERCPTIERDPNRKFVITLKAVIADEQPRSGGWRWHKWGPYIGVHEPQCEYLHDEPEIQKVYVYHVFEKEPG